MIFPGETLENPVTGERFTFTDTAASTGGELLAFDFGLRPGGAVPIPHVHPIQTERFEVVSGSMRFRVGLRTFCGSRRRRRGRAGRHARLRQRRRGEARCASRSARAGDGGDVREVIAMAEAGRMTRRGLPRNLVDARRARAPLRPGGARAVPQRRPPARPARAAPDAHVAPSGSSTVRRMCS